MKSLLTVLITLALLFWGHNTYVTLQEHYLRNRVVLIHNTDSLCSGVQIQVPSGKNYIMTASHCVDLKDNNSVFNVTDEGGKDYKLKFVAESPVADLLLIEGIPNLSGISIAKSEYLEESVRTFTHGGGFTTFRTEGHLLTQYNLSLALFEVLTPEDIKRCSSSHKFSFESPNFILVCTMTTTTVITDAIIIPGSSGGMVVDDWGHLVGIVSATNGRLGFVTTLKDIKEFLKNL